MPTDNQMGDHDDLWPHCFPDGVVNAISPNVNNPRFQCFIYCVDLQITIIDKNWYRHEIARYSHKWWFFPYLLQIENANRKGSCGYRRQKEQPCHVVVVSSIIRCSIGKNDSGLISGVWHIHIYWAMYRIYHDRLLFKFISSVVTISLPWIAQRWCPKHWFSHKM